MDNESVLLGSLKFVITPLLAIALYLLCCHSKWPCTREDGSEESPIYVIPMPEEDRRGPRGDSRPHRRAPSGPSSAPTFLPLPTTVYRPPDIELPPYSSVDPINPLPPYTLFNPQDHEDILPSYQAVIADVPPVCKAVVVPDDLSAVLYPPLPPIQPPLSPHLGDPEPHTPIHQHECDLHN